MLEFLELRNTADQTVVDLGCGTGATALFAAGLFKAVYAVDVSSAMFEKAKAKSDRTIHSTLATQQCWVERVEKWH